MGFHVQVGRGRTPAQNRAEKVQRVREGTTHAALVLDDQDCLGWCQFGPPQELPQIKSRREDLTNPPDWRVTCFFTGKGHRGRGIAAAALGTPLGGDPHRRPGVRARRRCGTFHPVSDDPQPAPPRWDGSLFSGPVHGPMPIMLLALTTTTGLVDAVSVLSLGRVFVANMTGNVVFLGFAIAGVPGFALGASLAALSGFLAGALLGGRIVAARGARRGRLLRDTTLVELLLVLVGVALLAPAAGPPGGAVAAVVAAVVAVALGLQNSTVRHIGIPDLTTTVLTMTLTGIAVDVRTAGRPVVTRRVLAVLTMFAGALLGGLLVLATRPVWALAAAAALLLAVAAALTVSLRHPAPWQVGA